MLANNREHVGDRGAARAGAVELILGGGRTGESLAEVLLMQAADIVAGAYPVVAIDQQVAALPCYAGG